MRAILALVLLLMIAGGTFYALQSDDAAPPPIDAPEPTDQERQTPPPSSAVGDRDLLPSMPAGSPDEPAPTNEQRNEGPATTSGQAAAEPPVTVTLQVRNVVDKQPLAPFQWRFVSGGETVRGTSEQARASLTLPAGRRGELLVEADAMQPFSQRDFAVPTPPAAAKNVDVFLTPSANATGITLLVRDLSQQPVQNVRVHAYQITNDNRETSWQLGQALWARAADAADGVYQLPPLPAGEFGILLVALDAAGEPRPLMPYRRAFTLTGSNGFVEDVPLEPACHLVLELVEPNGAAFDPANHGQVTLGLRTAGAPPQQRMWTGRDGEQGKLRNAVNALPGKGAAWPTEPLPAGAYLLEVFVNGNARVQQNVFLRAGERQVERVIVR